jgi:dihydroxyacid dehydratase/phosphogluconate dehydratase
VSFSGEILSHFERLRKVLHLLAMARAADVELAIDDFQMIADKTPLLADLM